VKGSSSSSPPRTELSWAVTLLANFCASRLRSQKESSVSGTVTAASAASSAGTDDALFFAVFDFVGRLGKIWAAETLPGILASALTLMVALAGASALF
jgi:hypothetical protein